MTLQAHAQALYEGIRPLLGDHSPDHVQTRLERDLRHMIPQWSERLPDCPGWYWFNLKTAVGSRKSAQPLDAPRKWNN